MAPDAVEECVVGAVHLRGDGRAARAAVARLRARGVEVVEDVRDRGTTGPAAGDLLLDLSPPAPDRRTRWASAADRGAHVLAASLDPGDLAWARDEWAAAAEAAGTVLLPTAGQGAVLGDALAAIAATAAEEAEEVHTAHLLLEHGGLLRAAGPGLRAEVAALVGATAIVVDGGLAVAEPVGERRRLAWFARPVGPHHAATVPAPEVLTIPGHVPSARLVAGHLAMRTWQAELLQALGALAVRRPGFADRARARVAVPPRRPARRDARWAVVAEARGRLGVARAWANGRDPATTTGEVAAALAVAVLAGGARGVPAPARLVEPATLLDALADDADLRWSVVRPDPDAS